MPEKHLIAQFSSQIYCTTVLEYYSSICMSARGETRGSYSTILHGKILTNINSDHSSSRAAGKMTILQDYMGD